MEIIKYELKYCERCGTLKLRRVASKARIAVAAKVC